MESKKKKKDLKEAEDNLWKLQLAQDGCARQLALTQAYFRLGTANK